MEKALDWLRYALAAIGGTIAALLGGWSTVLKVLALFVVLDYLTGLAAAWVSKTLSSKVGAKGIVKKVLIFLVVMVAAQVDALLVSATASIPNFPTLPAICGSLTACFYIANEGLSILENASEIGLPIPGALKNALEQIRKKGDEGDKTPEAPAGASK